MTAPCGAVRLRAYRPKDRGALEDICLRTGDAGQDASELTDDPTLLGELYLGPYLAAAPELALVAEADGVVAGYALGVLDTAEFERWCDAHWWAPARARHPVPSAPRPFDRDLHARLLDPPRHPVPPGYPSHLHIDLLPQLQGRGVGRRLMNGLLSELRARGSPGVHLGVDLRNVAAQRFYERLGLSPLGPDRDGVRYLGIELGPDARTDRASAVS